MARPRSFDEKQVLSAAMQVFWKKGFSGTSYDDLSRAMKLNSPSIYAAFGDKEALFLRAVDLYMQECAVPAMEQLGQKSFRKALLDFFDGMIAKMTSKDATGCMIVCSLSPSATMSLSFKKKLRSVVVLADSMLTERVKHAQADGEIDAREDAEAIGRALNDLRYGLGLRARSGESAAELKSALRRQLKALKLI